MNRAIVVVEERIHLDYEGMWNELGKIFQADILDEALCQITQEARQRKAEVLQECPDAYSDMPNPSHRDLRFKSTNPCSALLLQTVGFKLKNVPKYFAETSYWDIIEADDDFIKGQPSSLVEVYGKQFDLLLPLSQELK